MTQTEKLKRGRVIRRGFKSKCPHCAKTKQLSVWALAHLNEVLVATCECGKKYEIGGRGK